MKPRRPLTILRHCPSEVAQLPSEYSALTQARGMGPLPGLVTEQHGERSLAKLLRRHGLPLAVVDQRDARVPLVDMVGLFESAARLSGDPFFGLRVGGLMRVTDYGCYILHAAAAPKLGRGIERTVRGIRYYQAAGALRLELRGQEACFSYRQHVTTPEAGRQHADHVLPAVLGFVRLFLGQAWRPARYVVPYARHGLSGRLETLLRGAVEFGRDGAGVVFDRALLELRTTSSAPDHAPGLRDLRQLVRTRPSDSLGAAVAQIAELQLLDARVDLAGTAARLRLRPRTLQRQLAAEGTSYREIIDRIRFETACRLLQETRLTVAEIADRLGYAEHPHLTRAFRRLAGCSPAEYRQLSGRAGH